MKYLTISQSSGFHEKAGVMIMDTASKAHPHISVGPKIIRPN